MKLREKIGITEQKQLILTRLMQLVLLLLIAAGLWTKNGSLLINSTVSLLVTFLPAMIERDYEVPMDAGIVLWITLAVFLHAVGALGPYRQFWWWDHMTHTLSATIVAGAAYATLRAFDEHSPDIDLPKRFMFVFILLFTMAFGVIWEVLEFFIAIVSDILGTGTVLTQYGMDDTMKDLMFDTLGGIIIGLWGTAHLTDVAGGIRDWLDERAGLGRQVFEE